MVTWGGEGGRATVRNARLARFFRPVTYELATSLDVARRVHDLAAACIR